MFLKDLKIYFILAFFFIFLLDIILMFPAMGYEEGITQSKGAEIAYYVVAITLFSLSFWSRYLSQWDMVAEIMTVATSAFIFSVFINYVNVISSSKILKKSFIFERNAKIFYFFH